MSKRAIVISVIVICAAALTLAILAALLMSSGGGSVACVYSEGRLLYSIDLNTVAEPYEIVIDYSGGGSNTVRVERGRICVSSADCPDETCVKTGWLSNGSVPIICIPHRLEIRLEQGNGLDGVAQ